MSLNSDPNIVSRYELHKRIIHARNILGTVDEHLYMFTPNHLAKLNAEVMRIIASDVFKKVKV